MKKPDAIFIFQQSQSAHSRYLLHEHRGIDIPDFPAVYVRGNNAGKKYIGFRATVQNKPGHRHFTHSLELDKARMVTGLNFTPEFPRKAYGDYKADGLLIEFSKDWKHLTMYFFQGMKCNAANLFQRWVAGELPETAVADALPLETKKAELF